MTGPQHLGSSIPAISDHDDPPGAKERLESPKLVNRYSNRRLLAADALEIQRGDPTARLFGQQAHHREHPSNADGFVSQRQVRDVDVAAILTGLRFWALFCSGINRDPHQSICWHFLQHAADAQRSQALEIDLPIGQCCRDAGPLPLEKGRMGEFGQRAGLWLAQQAVTQTKQGIGSLLQAVVNLLTKRFQSVKVHLESAPLVFCLTRNSTPLGNLLQQEIA